MVTQEKIEQILRISVNAPSGHNYQPWKFQIEGNCILVENVPENDPTIYNYNQKGSYIGNGAIIENIAIVSSHFGLSADIKLLPDPSNENVCARIDLTEGTEEYNKSSLFPQIRKRATNRKPYDKRTLTTKEKNSLLEMSSDISGVTLELIEDRSKIDDIAKAFTENDKLIFTNDRIHDALFPHIVWDDKQEKKKASGLYIKTFELPPPIKVAFTVFKHRPVASFLGKIGFGNVVAKQNSELYSSCSAIGAFFVDEESTERLLEVGCSLQRTWLKATELGLSVHPIMGTIYLDKRFSEGNTSGFTAKQVDNVTRGAKLIRDQFQNSGSIAFIFRLGCVEPPTAISSKKVPDILYI